MRLKVDPRDVVHKHALMTRRLIEGQQQASREAGEAVVQSIRRDLESKILRPRESTGLLASKITYAVHPVAGGGYLIGIGDIARMFKTVPYWRLIDEGGPIAATVVPGFFVDISGRRVPFDQSRAPKPGSPSMDMFIYTPKGQWVSPVVFAGDAEATASLMFVHKPINPKHYFDSGADQARAKVFMIFKRWFLQAFR